MPRKRQPPRLYFREDEQVWIIRDGSTSQRTGSGPDDSGGAQKALAQYISQKFNPAVRERDPDRLSVGEVLTAYGREHAPTLRAPATIGYAIAALAQWWGARQLTEVRAATCRAYLSYRAAMQVRGSHISDGTVRRELGVLAAAINHWHKEHGPLSAVPVVTLPSAPEPHPDWLTRGEAAALLAGALGWYRERWSNLDSRQERCRWRRDHGHINRHAARFIIMGLYTGTRSGAILSTSWKSNSLGGWVDLARGVYHRRGVGEPETNKRRPPVKLGRRILAHLRRWERLDDQARDRAAAAGAPGAQLLNVVSYNGDAVEKIRRSWDSAVELSGIGRRITPHVLRHTRATWMMQAGIALWEAAGSLGMSVKMLQDVYGHQHPDFQKKAAEV